MNVLVAILTLEVIVLIVTTLRHKLNETEIQQGKTDPELKEAIIEKHPYATMSYGNSKRFSKPYPKNLPYGILTPPTKSISVFDKSCRCPKKGGVD